MAEPLHRADRCAADGDDPSSPAAYLTVDVLGTPPKPCGLGDPATFVHNTVAYTLHAVGYGDHAVELSVSFVSDAEMQALNGQYRGKDKTTNVLAFPGYEPDELKRIGARQVDGPPLHFGDVVIAGDVVLREAAEQSKKPADHLRHLLVHASLHLVGYDHIDPEDAEKMEALEAQLLANWQIPNPYGTCD